MAADRPGPGIIRNVHTSGDSPDDLLSRALGLVIWLDDAAGPAVLSPLAGCFGEKCSGTAGVSLSDPSHYA